MEATNDSGNTGILCASRLLRIVKAVQFDMNCTQ